MNLKGVFQGSATNTYRYRTVFRAIVSELDSCTLLKAAIAAELIFMNSAFNL